MVTNFSIAKSVLPAFSPSASKYRSLAPFFSASLLLQKKFHSETSYPEITFRVTAEEMYLLDKKIEKINIMDENLYHLKISYRENNK